MGKGKEGGVPNMNAVKNWLALQAIDQRLDSVRDAYPNPAQKEGVTDALATLRLQLQDDSAAIPLKPRGVLGRLFRRTSPVEDQLLNEYRQFQREEYERFRLVQEAEIAEAERQKQLAQADQEKLRRERLRREDLEDERAHVLTEEESITDGAGWRVFAPAHGLAFQEKASTTRDATATLEHIIDANESGVSKALLSLSNSDKYRNTMITVGKRVIRDDHPRRFLQLDVRKEDTRWDNTTRIHRKTFVSQEYYYLQPEGDVPDVTYDERGTLVVAENPTGNHRRFISSIVGFHNVQTDVVTYVRFRTENDDLQRPTIEMTQMEVKPVDKLPNFVPQ